MKEIEIDLEEIEKLQRKKFKETKKNMTSLGTYRKEFDVIIKRYSEMQVQFDMLNKRWYLEGCKVTEQYTNKAGATNERKTALYLAIENLRSELTDMENIFGLTPKGLNTIKRKGLEQRKTSALEKMLGG